MVRSLAVALTALLVTVLLDPAHAQRAGSKVKLDTIEKKRIGGGDERVVLRVGRGEGRFEAIAIRPLERPLRIRRVEVTFGNGRKQAVPVREWLAEGEISNIIDLKGDERFIRSVEVTIRPFPSNRRAGIELLGVAAEPEFDVVGTSRVSRGEGEITYELGRNAGRFEAIALRALDRDFRVRNMEIVFGNGERQNVRVRGTLDEGQMTELIDLRGDERFIRAVYVVIRPLRGNRSGRLQLVARAADGRRTPVRGGPVPRKPAKEDWVLLGTQKAGLFRTDQDVFRVGRDKGRFRAIKVTAKRHDIRMYGMQITYGNGSTETVPVRGSIEDGYSSPPYDLKGRDRFIQHIAFRYRTKLNFKGTGRVELWGLRTD